MLIGNKKDLDDSRDVSYEEAAKFAQENGIQHLSIYLSIHPSIPSFPSSKKILANHSIIIINQLLQDYFIWKLVPKRKLFLSLKIWQLFPMPYIHIFIIIISFFYLFSLLPYHYCYVCMFVCSEERT